MKIISKTNDIWAQELLECIPKNDKKIIILVSTASQVFLTIPVKIFGFKTIWIGSNNEQSRIPALSLKIMSKFADNIIASNQSIEAKYLRKGLSSKKIHIIYPPCIEDTDVKPSQDNIIIACDGIITIDQGLGILIQSIASVKEILPNIKLIIGGKIADAQKINWITKQLKLERDIQLVPTNKKTWMSSSHIYILPTTEDVEPPCSLAQAMMLSKAIIATDKLDHHEFIEQNKNGILIKQNNVDMLSQAIINLARKPDWMRELGQNNLEFAKQKFSEEVFREKIKNIFG